MAYGCQVRAVRQNTGLAEIEWGLILVVIASAGVCLESRQLIKRPK